MTDIDKVLENARKILGDPSDYDLTYVEKMFTPVFHDPRVKQYLYEQYSTIKDHALRASQDLDQAMLTIANGMCAVGFLLGDEHRRVQEEEEKDLPD